MMIYLLLFLMPIQQQQPQQQQLIEQQMYRQQLQLEQVRRQLEQQQWQLERMLGIIERDIQNRREPPKPLPVCSVEVRRVNGTDVRHVPPDLAAMDFLL
jgi:hypothetical protein